MDPLTGGHGQTVHPVLDRRSRNIRGPLQKFVHFLIVLAYTAFWPFLAAVLERSDGQAALLIVFGALLTIPIMIVYDRRGRLR